jgi:hypothetical protein
MKNTFYNILMVAGVCCVFAACSSGDYNANPSSPANQSVNPLTPLDSAQFTWSGSDPFSANTSSGGFQAKVGYAWWVFDDTTGADIITAVNGKQLFQFYLLGTYAGHIYSLGHNVMKTKALFVDNDSAADPVNHTFYSYNGNSGEIQILQNDTSRIKGLFYFQGVNANNGVVNVSNGYFNIKKHP